MIRHPLLPPWGWNTIKFVIGNVGNNNIDSWAFLRSGLFSCIVRGGGVDGGARMTTKGSRGTEDSAVLCWMCQRWILLPLSIPHIYVIVILIFLGLLVLLLPVIGQTFYNKWITTEWLYHMSAKDPGRVEVCILPSIKQWGGMRSLPRCDATSVQASWNQVMDPSFFSLRKCPLCTLAWEVQEVDGPTHTKHKNEYVINCNWSYHTSLQPYFAYTGTYNCYCHHLYFLLGCRSGVP